MKTLKIILTLFCAANLFAQKSYYKEDSFIYGSDQKSKENLFCLDNKPAVPEKSNWKNDLTGRLNITQISFERWKAGGENAFAWQSMIDGKYYYRDTIIDWKTTHRFSYGETKQGDKEFRKNDDLIDFSSVFSYLMGWTVDPYISVTFRSQFTKGYDYNTSPPTKIADFMDPGFLMQNIGFQYIPKIEGVSLSFRFGFSVKETFLSNDNLLSKQMGTSQVQFGSEFVTDYQQNMNSIISMKAKLESFTNYKRFDETAMRLDILMTFRIIRHIAVSINGVAYYNKSESRQFQLKDVISIGLLYSVFE